MATLVDMAVDMAVNTAEAVGTADIAVNMARISAVNKQTTFLLTLSMIS
jgi:t-SNARE complex subunit (syntaxin)